MAGELSVVGHAILPAETADCWRFLTVPALLAEWFADAEGVLLPEHRFVFRFGDGDFFVCKGIEAAAPVKLQFSWQFMGVGQVSRITYYLQPLSSGTKVSVVDEGRYSLDVARELEEGWEDFLARLERRIRTGNNARYRWTEYISASAVLSASVENAFVTCLSRLRSDGTSFGVRIEARIKPDLSQRTIDVSLHSAAWGGRETKAVLTFAERENGTKLSVIHSGWAALDSEIQFSERKRLAGFWADFLEQLEARGKPLDELESASLPSCARGDA